MHLFDYDNDEEIPFCIDCSISLRAVPLSRTEVHYFCRGCGLNYTLDEDIFGNRPPPSEFKHCKELQESRHVR